jgi:hypothetical protein
MLAESNRTHPHSQVVPAPVPDGADGRCAPREGGARARRGRRQKTADMSFCRDDAPTCRCSPRSPGSQWNSFSPGFRIRQKHLRCSTSRAAVERFDVAIVGARCAGSPLVALLADSGLAVCVLDRAHFPSDTPSTQLVHRRRAGAGATRRAERGEGRRHCADRAGDIYRRRCPHRRAGNGIGRADTDAVHPRSTGCLSRRPARRAPMYAPARGSPGSCEATAAWRHHHPNDPKRYVSARGCRAGAPC